MKKKFYLIMALLLGLAMVWSSASASVLDRSPEIPAGAIIYVDADALGANDGTSWANAFIGLQSALGASVSGDQIWVAEGIYQPSASADRIATFQLKSGVAVYGGFDPSGGDIAWEDRDWETNLTTLSGDIGVIADSSDNSYHVVTGSGVDATAILDGFTITGGNANGSSPNNYGGGMYNNAGSPRLVNLTFNNNSAATRGGGMFNNASSNPMLEDVTLSVNSAAYGGGMLNYSSSPTLDEVTFTDNSASQEGGGMYNFESSPTLTHSTFTSNYAGQNGGGMYNAVSSPTLSNVIFSTNGAGARGGGIYNNSGSDASLTNSIFYGNSAAYGSGMLNYESNPSLVNVLFSGNIASQNGGGMYNYMSAPLLTNVTLSGNSAPSGGGIYNNTSSPTVDNAILWGNTSGQFYNGTGSAPVISYSDVQGGCPSGATCTQVIDSDPQFISNPSPGGDSTWGTLDDDYGDLHVQLTSPAIDAADNTRVPAGVVGDLDGNPRFTDVLLVPDTGNGTAPIVDMGAYEANTEMIAPTVESILRADPSPTNAASVDYTVTFSEAVSGVGVSDFALTLSVITGASVTGVSGGPAVYTVSVSTGSGDGTLRLDIPGTASISDLVGNALAGLPYTGGQSYTIDKSAPTVVSILRANQSPTNAASVGYTVTFSETVIGVGVNDFTLTLSGITGATVTGVGGGPTTYTVTVSTGTGSGTLRLDIPGTASVVDQVGNPLSGLPYETGESYTIDKIAPTVLSILRADPNPTNAGSVDYTVTFSEAVNGVSTSDFTLTTSGIIDMGITSVSGGPTTYNVTIDTGRRDGTLRLDIPASASITDLVGNPTAGLPYTSGEVYTIDRDEPVVVSVLRADPNPTGAASVDYTVTFSEAVVGVDVSDFTLTASGITGAAVTSVSDGPTIYTVTASTGTGNGTLRLDIPTTASITDLAGNPLSDLPFTSGELYTIDKTATTVVSILSVDPSPTYAASVGYMVTFSEAVVGVDVSDFTLTVSGITGAAVTSVSGGPTAYSVTVSTGSGDGTLRLDIPETASITDSVGNPLIGLPYTGGESYAIDKTAPTVVSILRADPNPTTADSVRFTVTFSEAMSGVGVSDFSLFTTGSLSGSSVTDVSGTGSTYTVTVAVGSGIGSLRLDIQGAAVITDLVGNLLSGLPYQSGQAYTILLQIYLPVMAKHTP